MKGVSFTNVHSSNPLFCPPPPPSPSLALPCFSSFSFDFCLSLCPTLALALAPSIGFFRPPVGVYDADASCRVVKSHI